MPNNNTVLAYLVSRLSGKSTKPALVLIGYIGEVWEW